MSEKLDEKTEDHVKIIEDRPSDLSRLDIGRNSSLVLIRKTRNVSQMSISKASVKSKNTEKITDWS